MKKIAERVIKGKRVATVELEPGEELVAIVPGRHYKLGYPYEDIVPSDRILEAQPVVWDDVEQKWTT